MADRPIIFTSAMTRALLENRKTQTRRIPSLLLGFGFGRITHANEGRITFRNQKTKVSTTVSHDGFKKMLPWQIGDRLWVRERFALDGIAEQELTPNALNWFAGVTFAADGLNLARNITHDEFVKYRKQGRWGTGRPAIHMPRWASRITLIVTDVRVERLQDISEADAVAEGLQGRMDYCRQYRGADDLPWRAEFPRDAYRDLWDSINTDNGHEWDTNPWVVALTFDVINLNIDKVPEVSA